MLGDLLFKGRLQCLGDLASWASANLMLDISAYYGPPSSGPDHPKQAWVAKVAELLMYLLDKLCME